jgi:hypothetical protein
VYAQDAKTVIAVTYSGTQTISGCDNKQGV